MLGGCLAFLMRASALCIILPTKRRQFGLDQDIPNDFSAILESFTSVRPFLRPSAFEFFSRHFTAITIPSSQRECLCIVAMHGY